MTGRTSRTTPAAAERLIRAGEQVSKGAPPSGFKNFSDEVYELRTRLGLTQEQFCTRYNVPIGNLRNWEQKGRVVSPDKASRLLIAMIAVNPDQVAKLISQAKSRKVAVEEDA
jgi:DNA-binding transcriptional regulator YiaG